MPYRKKPPREDRGKNHSPTYYVPGQLLFTVEHDHQDADALVSVFKDTKLFREEKRFEGATIDPRRVLTIDRAAQASFYQSTANQQQEAQKRRKKNYFPKGARDRPRVTTDPDLLPSAANFVSTISIQLRTRDKKRLPAVVNRLNRAILGLRRAPQNGLVFRGVSPNWFVNGVQNHTGGSGPGGRPTPAEAPASENEFRIILESMPNLDGSQAEAPVDVVILDTAPPREILDAAKGDSRNSALLQRLLGAGGKLTIQYADDIANELGLATGVLPSPTEHYIKHHDFPQPDHGLFVAGIVNTIAPNANIYLLEVLGARGVGTDESIERGLLWALEHRAKHPERMLIVNCSLMMVLPPPWLAAEELASYWALFNNPNLGSLPEYKLLSRPLEESCYHLRLPASLVVAAAGNDGDEPDAAVGTEVEAANGLRRDARYPAAFDTVLGVGALKEGSTEPTHYSNTSDEPEGVGIATFGGEKAADVPVSDTQVGTGLLGVFTGEYPDYDVPPAEHPGWAWWAGTSFAAPVITGTLAALAGLHGSLEAAKNELNAHVIDPPDGTFGGRFPAKQGV
jgi:hypothetical protein